jgi:uncharacterized membrane protein
MNSNPNLSSKVKRLFIYAIMLLSLTILAEFLTLVGSKTYSFCRFQDWNFHRMFLLFCINLLLLLFINYFDLKGRWLSFFSNLKQKVTTANRNEKAAFVKKTISLIAVPATTLFIYVGLASVRDYRWAAFCFFIPLAIGLIIIFQNDIRKHVEIGFLIITLTIGIVFCISVPVTAFISWDGLTHFDRAWALSYLYDAEYSGAEQDMLTYNPASAWEQRAGIKGTGQYSFDSLALENMNKIYSVLKQDEKNGKLIRTSGIGSFNSGGYASLASIGYIPSAIGLWTGRLLHFNCIGIYFMGKLFNLIFYSLLMTFAIRNLKYGKLLLSAIGLMPTILLLSVNFTYDPWCICFLSYAFSRFIGDIQKNRIFTKKEAVLIGVTFILGAFVRAIYFPLALIFLLSPDTYKDKKGGIRKMKTAAIIIIVLLLLSLGLNVVLNPSITTDIRGGNVNSKEQLEFILHNPISYLITFSKLMLNIVGLNNGNYLNVAPYLIPASIQYNPDIILRWDNVISEIVFYLIFIMAVVDTSEECRVYTGIKNRLMVLFSLILTAGTVCSSMYLAFTPVGAARIEGVQLRYFFPLLFPFLLITCRIPVKNEISSNKLNLAFIWIESAIVLMTFLIDFRLFV